jgi:hypothetical protein
VLGFWLSFPFPLFSFNPFLAGKERHTPMTAYEADAEKTKEFHFTLRLASICYPPAFAHANNLSFLHKHRWININEGSGREERKPSEFAAFFLYFYEHAWSIIKDIKIEDGMVISLHETAQ